MYSKMEDNMTELQIQRIQDVPRSNIVSMVQGNKKKRYLIAKRILDILLSCLALTILSPLLLLTMLAIRLDSPGKAMFTQMRTGKDGKEFKMYKFRSMCVGAELMHERLKRENGDGGVSYKPKDDFRITQIGKFIRRTSIDELPQLINIIKGDMSIVGPRPLPIYEDKQLKKFYRRRYQAIPGLTCYWQASGRSEMPFEERMELDIKYINEARLWLDIKIIFMTIPAIITSKGAY